MENLNRLALEAQKDEALLAALIKNMEPFILKCAGKTTHRYISKNDDEWSIALLAFNQAIQGYNEYKGAFMNFADLIIRRRLADYYRSQNKYKEEVSVDPYVFEGDVDEAAGELSLQINVVAQIKQMQVNDLKLEIEALNTVLAEYDFGFFDLVQVSPKAGKTKKACAKAIMYLLDTPLLLAEMKQTKQLPLKVIEKNTKIPRKILERHRKYIITATEILSGEYPCLAEYMRFAREESVR